MRDVWLGVCGVRSCCVGAGVCGIGRVLAFFGQWGFFCGEVLLVVGGVFGIVVFICE